MEEEEKIQKDFLKKTEKILDERQYIKMRVFDEKLKYDLFRRFRDRDRRNDDEKREKSSSTDRN